MMFRWLLQEALWVAVDLEDLEQEIHYQYLMQILIQLQLEQEVLVQELLQLEIQVLHLYLVQ